jgi:cyanate permease
VDVRRHEMSIPILLRRLLNERRLFIRCITALSATIFAGTFAWLLDARGGLLVWVILVSVGGGWLVAYYMWHVNYAAAHWSDPLVPPKHDEDKDRDV